MQLRSEQKTIAAMTPQLYMTAKLLAMTGEELADYINREIEENPVLDFPGEAGSPELFEKKIEWTVPPRYYCGPQSGGRGSEALPDCTVGIKGRNETLYDHLSIQLTDSKLPQRLRKLVLYIIGSLEPSGYLYESIEEFVYQTGASAAEVGAALDIVRNLDPAGVGAGNLADCLLLQAERGALSPLCREIIMGYLPELAKNHYAKIAGELGASDADVRQAAEDIRVLDPRPGSVYSDSEQPFYVIPEIEVVYGTNGLEVSLLDGRTPTVAINSRYLSMARDCEDKELAEFLKKYILRAKNLRFCMEQRRNMLLRCTEEIVRRQSDFFINRSALKPMQRRDIAGVLNVHESTICRAIKGKYVQCLHGVYSLESLFSRGLTMAGEGGDSVSAAAVKGCIRELVAGENPQNPLSDQKICDRLQKEKDLCIARRTVAKYRTALGIAPASARKIF